MIVSKVLFKYFNTLFAEGGEEDKVEAFSLETRAST